MKYVFDAYEWNEHSMRYCIIDDYSGQIALLPFSYDFLHPHSLFLFLRDRDRNWFFCSPSSGQPSPQALL